MLYTHPNKCAQHHPLCIIIIIIIPPNTQHPLSQGRTPLDLASAELKTYLQGVHAGDLFSWGHGANYQLGTGATGVAVNPARVDSMGTRVVAVAAAKFHSTALAADGRVFTWGFGRGGRLGTCRRLENGGG